MNKILLTLFLFPTLIFAQTQIGSNINGEAAEDQAGHAVSISSDGSVIALGARYNDGNGSNSGHVQVYENQGGVWTQIGSDINGEAIDDQSGASVSLSSNGNIVAIGAFANDANGNASGHVRIYENIASVWTQVGQDIDGQIAGDGLGWSVSLSSNGSIVATRSNGVDGAGLVRVYENIGGVWTQIGSDINGEASIDQFGISVSISLDGSVIAIGAQDNDGNGSNSGHARVYENIGGVWTQIGSDIDGEAIDDQSGGVVSLSSNGKIVAIGAIGNDGNGSNSGHVRVYENIGGVWTKIGQDIDGEAAGDRSGSNVSLSSDGTILAVGGIFNFGNAGNSGHIRIYKNIGGVWTQKGQDIDGQGSLDLLSDVALSSDGTILVTGARNSSNNGTRSGHVSVYDLSIVLSSNDFVFSQFTLYPNPTNTQFSIQVNESLQLEVINIYNNLGQLIKKTINKIIDVSAFSKGVYFVEIITNKGKASKKVVID